MSIFVSFIRPSGRGFATGIKLCRVRETLAINDTTAAVAEDGEMVLIENGETTPVFVAWGSTPDASAAASTTSTSAGITIPPGAYAFPIEMHIGDKINVKAAS